MAMVIEAVYEGGVFRPRFEVPLAEGQVVEIRISEAPPADEERALADLMSLAGMVHGADPDAASAQRVEAALAAQYVGQHPES